jgi:hypothetical protein
VTKPRRIGAIQRASSGADKALAGRWPRPPLSHGMATDGTEAQVEVSTRLRAASGRPFSPSELTQSFLEVIAGTISFSTILGRLA